MNKIKDPVSAITHFIGAVLSIPITIAMITVANNNGAEPVEIASLLIFGLSLFLLYTASTVYHTIDGTEETNVMLKKIDHMMIYVLIAGTYTPICLMALRYNRGLTILFIVWAVAIVGMIVKIFWIDAPRWLSTLLYVGLGWASLLLIYPLYKATSAGAVALLALGGISYTVGAVIYATKRPKINNKYFGFHEIFHLFVLLGSALHIAFVFIYVI